MAIDVLHHHHGRLDDDAEVDRAERDEIGWRAREYHPAEGRHQREGDVHGGDGGRARLPEEHPEDHGDEDHADEEILEHGAGGQLHQLRAVVVRLDFHPDGKHVVLANEIHAFVHALQGLQGRSAVAHQDDPLHHVGLEILADDAEPRRGAYADLRDVADAHRGAGFRLREHDLPDVVERADEAKAAHVERLLSQGEPLPAHVLVGVGKRLRELAEGERVTPEPVRIDVDVEFLCLATEPDHVDHAGHLAELPFEDEVLRGLQLRQRVTSSLQRVPVDFADRAPGGELRLDAGR